MDGGDAGGRSTGVVEAPVSLTVSREARLLRDFGVLVGRGVYAGGSGGVYWPSYSRRRRRISTGGG